MILTRSILNDKIKPINMYLADCNHRIMYTIPSQFIHDLNIKYATLNTTKEITFKLYKYYNEEDEDGNVLKQVRFEGYDHVEEMCRMKVDNFHWFYIKQPDEKIDTDGNDYLDITMYSIEYEMTGKKIYVNSDEDETIDNMCKLYNPRDVEHSCLNIALKDLPHWRVGHISQNISNKAHDFTGAFDVTDAYTYLTDIVAQSFECVFVFDNENFTVNAYKVDDPEICIDSNVWFSDNVIKSLEKKADSEGIITCLSVEGGNDDYTGSGELGIIDVNGGLNNLIYNFSWVRRYWSEQTRNDYDRYQSAYTNYLYRYDELSVTRNDLIRQIEKLKNNVVSEGLWSEYGLEQLKSARDIKLEIIESYHALVNNAVSETDRDKAAIDYNNILAEISRREIQIKNAENQLNDVLKQIENAKPNLIDFVSNEGWLEIQRTIRQDDYKNDSIKSYENDTMDDVLEYERELKADAEKNLAEKCHPRYELTLDIINMLAMKEFDDFNEQIDIGLMCHINYDDNHNSKYHMYLRLLEIDFEDLNGSEPSIKVVFSNKSSLDNEGLFDEIMSQTQSMSTSMTYNMRKVKESAKSSKSFEEYKSADLDASLQRVVNSKDEDITWGEGGIMIRQKLDDGRYSPECMVLTHGQMIISPDGLRTASLSIGRILVPTVNGTEVTHDGEYKYGINAEILCGDLLIGSKLCIVNDSNNFTISNDGLCFKGINGVSINMNPNDVNNVFSISNSTRKTIWIDAGGNGNFSGKITASTFDNNNGTFKVGIDGRVDCGDLHATNAEIQGSISSSTITGSLFTSTAYDGTSVYNMSLNSANINFTNTGNTTRSLNMSYKGIGWEDSESLILTYILPEKVITEKLQTSEIHFVNTNSGYIHNTQNINIEAANIYLNGNVYVNGSQIVSRQEYDALASRVSALESKMPSLSS